MTRSTPGCPGTRSSQRLRSSFTLSPSAAGLTRTRSTNLTAPLVPMLLSTTSCTPCCDRLSRASSISLPSGNPSACALDANNTVILATPPSCLFATALGAVGPTLFAPRNSEPRAAIDKASARGAALVPIRLQSLPLFGTRSRRSISLSNDAIVILPTMLSAAT